MSVKLRYQENKDKVKSYYLHYTTGGKRRKEFLGIHVYPDEPKKYRDEKLRKAKILRARREDELLEGATGIKTPQSKNRRFKPFTDAYLSKYTKKNINTVRGAVNAFYQFAGEDIKANEITEPKMEDFMEYLKGSHLTGETPHNYWTKFKMVLKRAKKEGYFNDMPTGDLVFKGKKEKNLSKQILDLDELRILKDTPCGNSEVKKAFLFSCFTGTGMAEIRKLTWDHIKKDRLILDRSKTKTDLGKKLHRSVLEIIGERGRRNDYVFDIHISDTAVNKNIRNWVKRAEIEKDITFYCARHSFAVMMLRNGENLKTVADLMGHKKVETTARYLNYIKDIKDKAIDNLPSL